MIDYTQLYQGLQHIPELRGWLTQLPQQVAENLSPHRWGDLPDWRAAVEALPDIAPSSIELGNSVRIGQASDASPEQLQLLEQELRKLHPWRKGPWEIFGLPIDTEWRSDWKWDRVLPHLAPMENRLVLDVGCGNGYHCWRSYGAGARRVIGIDPSAKFVAQFYALKNISATTSRWTYCHSASRPCPQIYAPSIPPSQWVCSTTAALQWITCASYVRPCAPVASWCWRP